MAKIRRSNARQRSKGARSRETLPRSTSTVALRTTKPPDSWGNDGVGRGNGSRGGRKTAARPAHPQACLFDRRQRFFQRLDVERDVVGRRGAARQAVRLPFLRRV